MHKKDKQEIKPENKQLSENKNKFNSKMENFNPSPVKTISKVEKPLKKDNNSLPKRVKKDSPEKQ